MINIFGYTPLNKTEGFLSGCSPHVQTVNPQFLQYGKRCSRLARTNCAIYPNLPRESGTSLTIQVQGLELVEKNANRTQFLFGYSGWEFWTPLTTFRFFGNFLVRQTKIALPFIFHQKNGGFFFCWLLPTQYTASNFD